MSDTIGHFENRVLESDVREVSHPMQHSKGNLLYLTFLCSVSALGGLLFGFDTVVISGTLTALKAQFALGAAMEGWLVSSALLGCALGAIVAGSLADRFGRKPVLFSSGLLFVICSIGCALAWNLDILIWSRLIGGVGVGLASMVSPLYISEISPSHLRGRMVTLFQFAITVGICLALFSNAALQHLASLGTAGPRNVFYQRIVADQVWRAMFGMELIPALLFTTLCAIVPEAPRWLVKASRPDEARTILAGIGGASLAESELQEIEGTLSSASDSMAQLFQRGLRKALFVSLFLAIASELSGITVVFYYGPDILEKSGISLGRALGGFTSIGLVNVFFTVIAVWLMDIAGRRLLLLIGTIGAICSLTVVGIIFRSGHTEGILVVAMLCAFVACFAFSMGPIKWVIMSEIFPTKIRGRAMAIATLAVWVTDGIYNQFFPLLRNKLGIAGSFFMFSILLLPQILFAWKIMPETKGRTLEEIERSWVPSPR
jgi:MFS transporter, SP family, arabinose:H+ symporter